MHETNTPIYHPARAHLFLSIGGENDGIQALYKQSKQALAGVIHAGPFFQYASRLPVE